MTLVDFLRARLEEDEQAATQGGRALAEVDAKRALLFVFELEGRTSLIRILAAPYADHPDHPDPQPSASDLTP